MSSSIHLDVQLGDGHAADGPYVLVHKDLRRVLAPQYVGVFFALAGTPTNSQITQAGLARSLGVGSDYIRSAVKAMEAAGLLTRGRSRDAEGQFGSAAWQLTDLALVMRGQGESDQAIRAALATQFAVSFPGTAITADLNSRHAAEGATR